MFAKLKAWASKLKSNLAVLYCAYKDDRTPLCVKILSWFLLAYAISPIDLIPDFIPVLGYIDDLILLPLAIYFTIKLIPDEVINDCRNNAAEIHLKNSKIIVIFIVLLWLIILLLILKI